VGFAQAPQVHRTRQMGRKAGQSCLHHITQMAGQQQGFLDAVPAKLAQDPRQKRAVADG